MNSERELVVTYDEEQIALIPVPAAIMQDGEGAQRAGKRSAGKIAAVVLLCVVLLVGMGLGVVKIGIPAVQYMGALSKLERGDYAEARRDFVALGGFWKAEEHAAEAEKGRLYREALMLLEQGDRDGAKIRLTQLAGFSDAEDRLRLIESEILYEQAAQKLAKKDYLSAYESFAALGDFRDARQKAEECHDLQSERIYNEGCRLIARGELADAYRVLSSIPVPGYKNTAELVDEILATSVRLAEKYGETGDRGRTVTFLRLVEEIDPEKGAQLREKLIPEENFALDESFYIFDTSHITMLSTGTTMEEFASVVLYMIMYGQLNLGLTSHKEVDRITMVDRSLSACDLVCEIIPGHGSVYNPTVNTGDRYVNFRLNVEQEYSEHQRRVHIKTFQEFCKNSVLELAEAGLISEDMNARQKVEVIANWVGFYLTYDQSLKTHDVGVAVETTSGVCEAYAALLNRMCNLAGVASYGQIGDSGAGLSNARHIWSFHLDENGGIFYTDATWADSYSIDFSIDGTQEPTIELFLEYYLERCMRNGVTGKEGTYGADENMYICADVRWGSHRAERSEEEIIAYHNLITGKTAREE